jgi:hypothetical protein
MDYPTYTEWLNALPPGKRKQAVALADTFRKLGCDDPEGWSRSEIDQDIAQLARFLFLRPLWKEQIDVWRDDADQWIRDNIEQSHRAPNGFFADAGLALERLLACGGKRADIGSVARYVAYSVVFAMLYRISGGCDEEELPNLPTWGLFEFSGSGEMTGRMADALHEDLLGLDPSGREGRPA